MPFNEETSINVAAGQLADTVSALKRDGWQFVQLCAVKAGDGIDMVYSFRHDLDFKTVEVRGLAAGDHVSSISSWYMAAFVFENEAHDLFGVDIDGIAIDFGGKFYDVAIEMPMMAESPEARAAREKAEKIAAAKAAKAAREKAAAETSATASVDGEAEATVREGGDV